MSTIKDACPTGVVAAELLCGPSMRSLGGEQERLDNPCVYRKPDPAEKRERIA